MENRDRETAGAQRVIDATGRQQDDPEGSRELKHARRGRTDVAVGAAKRKLGCLSNDMSRSGRAGSS